MEGRGKDGGPRDARAALFFYIEWSRASAPRTFPQPSPLNPLPSPFTPHAMTDLSAVDQVLDKLMRDVEASVHAFYRGDVRQHTQRVKTDTFLREARQALLPLMGGADTDAGASAGATSAAGLSMTPDEVAAATRCVMAWLPMGPPPSASPASRCVAAAKEMTPTWGEREKARLALKRGAG